MIVELTRINVEHPASLHTDKIVCRLDNFPELLEALRDGDHLAVVSFWSGFSITMGSAICHLDEPTPTPEAAMKAHG